MSTALRIAFLLPGLHEVPRGAEMAFESVARALAVGGDDVTLFGRGRPREDDPYRFVHVPAAPRTRFESWPQFPPMRNSFRYEELSWMPGLIRRYRRSEFDVAVTCSFPFTVWFLRSIGRTPLVFVTQNGDWPAYDDRSENRWFSCDALVCTNQEFEERNRDRWNTALIPNGVDVERFAPGPGSRAEFDLPEDTPIVLMVSALDAAKRVQEGIEVVSRLDDVMLVVAGDGVLREEVDRDGERLLPGRFRRLEVPGSAMPALYRSADVVLHMTREESFGNVYVEAMATGRPLVAHDSAHTRWVCGDGASLVDTDDLAATAGAIAEALRAAPDPAVAEWAAERYSWTGIAERYREVLRDVVAAR